MGHSKAAKAKTHKRIVAIAAKRVRERGLAGVGIAELMKEAGLTPMQILQCATTNAAKLFGGETGAHIGKIEDGSSADLVILNSNPLDDIKNTSDIDTVIKNGVVYPVDSILH